MKKSILIIAVLLGSISLANAQDYATGIGFRGGPAGGITVKHFIGDKAAIEGLAAFHLFGGGLEITALYELHSFDLFDVDRLNIYYGAGAHVGVIWVPIVIGIDGILGLEYNLENIPINISVDYKPAFNITGGTERFWGDGGALSIRYIF